MKFLAFISIFLPMVFGNHQSVSTRPLPGAYPVGTPITIILDDVHACAGMRITVDGLEPGEFISGFLVLKIPNMMRLSACLVLASPANGL